VLRGMLDEAREGLLALDEHGTILEANMTAALLLGHERSRLIGKPFAARIALVDRRRFRAALGTLGPGPPATLELGLLEVEPRVRISLRALPRTSPRVVAVALTAETPIRVDIVQPAARRRVEHFFLRFPSAVVALREDQRVAFANGRARTMLGPPAVRTGALFGEGLPGELRALARRLVTVPVPLGPHVVELRDGRTLRVTGLPLAGDEPAVLLAEDVSEQQRHSRVMREFLRNAAHQLRTPLTAISAAVETLQAGAKERPLERDLFLGHIETHADRLARLARGLLLLARAESGEVVPLDHVAMQPLIEELIRDVEPRDAVALRVECEPLVAAIAAPSLLREVLAALLENAVRYTNEGEISVSAARRNGQVVVAVADSGPGILPEFTDRLFDPFFRVAPTGEGYGLGLAIAAQAVRAMHGEIDVASTPGEGTQFEVRLPAAPPEQAPGDCAGETGTGAP
jgi:signal transduction histidine kinase